MPPASYQINIDMLPEPARVLVDGIRQRSATPYTAGGLLRSEDTPTDSCSAF